MDNACCNGVVKSGRIATGVAHSEAMHYHSDQEVRELARTAQQLRIDALDMVFGAQSGHLGGPLSAAEIVAALVFSHLRIDPARPDWPERDRFLLSKGHASPILYAALARRGFFPVEELPTYRQMGTRLEGHPDPKLPGVEAVAGPLGHGVAIGAGIALGLRMGVAKPAAMSAPSAFASRARVYVLLGDGELDAGIIWEGAMTAAKYRLGNLVAIVDDNGVQQTGATMDIMPLQPLPEKWRAFGWHVQECDGHNVADVLRALDLADQVHARPSVIIAHTTKGRGVSFMEYDHRWHGGAPDRERYELARRELEEGLARWSS
jgi:transketolase